MSMDAALLAEANDKRMALLVHLLDDATEGQWSRAELEQRAQLLLDLVFAMLTSGRAEQSGDTLEQYAHRFADVVVEGVINQPRAWIPFELTSPDDRAA